MAQISLLSPFVCRCPKSSLTRSQSFESVASALLLSVHFEAHT